MEKYKGMTYITRNDGVLYKKIEKDKQKYHLYDKTREGLYKKYVDLKYKLENNLLINSSEVLFKDYAQKWFELTISAKAPATQVSVKNRLRHINMYIGNKKLKDIKQDDIKNIYTSMQKQGLLDTVNRTMMDCKRIFQSAVDNDLIEKNPCTKIEKLKYQKEERIPLKISEDKKVLETALKHKYGTFILTIRYCGLRPEESVALSIDDFDKENHILHIHQAVTYINCKPVLKDVKNKKVRDVPVPDILFNKLKEQVEKQKKLGSNFIFTKETDKTSLLTKSALERHLETFLRYLNKGESKKIHFTYYTLRHSFCTMLYYSNINIKEAQRIMGHSSAKMVYDIYTHLDSERENSKEKINNYLKEIYK